jgi:hypothetical protein
MAIRLKTHGVEFETDSTAEAMEVYRQLAKMNGQAAPEPTQRNKPSSPPSPGEPEELVLGSKAKGALRLLMLKGGLREATDIVAAHIGVNGAKGLAAITRQIRAWGKARFSLGDEQCVLTADGVISIPEPMASKLRGHEKEFLSE